jgi:D-arabinose 1-dehydrogenase-like Zn-dependent alcohol dehydrogenase
VITALHAVKRSGLESGDSAVVVGAGGVGQAIIQILQHVRGVRVAATDLSADKLRIAEEMGAVPSLSTPPGCVFNCVGSAASMRASADLVMRCGRIVVIGEEPGPLPIDTTEIAQRELEIIGSRNGTRADMEEAIHLVESGFVRPLIAARFPLDEINAAFDSVRAGALGRVVITVS